MLLEGQAPTLAESCVPRVLISQMPALILGVGAAGFVMGWVYSLGKEVKLTGLKRNGVFQWEVAVLGTELSSKWGRGHSRYRKTFPLRMEEIETCLMLLQLLPNFGLFLP